MKTNIPTLGLAAALASLAAPADLQGQFASATSADDHLTLTAGLNPCPNEAQLQNWTQSTFTSFPNFIPGEQAGATLHAPAEDYPIEILQIQLHWAAQIPGGGQQIEQGIHLYAGGLPNPGTPQFSLPGPTLTEGTNNIFDISGIAGNKIINAGPFTVTIEFLNQSAGAGPFAPSVVADGDGCQLGRNPTFVIPGGWNDACQLGVTGDWVFHVIYRRLSCDCNSNGVFDDDDIAGATSADCNTNAIPDECDLATGSSEDCNTNGIPDECELLNNDCNTNGRPDECDLDFDGDGLIDDCDPDIDNDGITNGPDVCDFTPAGSTPINNPASSLHGTLRGDYDDDCDVDLSDFQNFANEFTGPNP